MQTMQGKAKRTVAAVMIGSAWLLAAGNLLAAETQTSVVPRPDGGKVYVAAGLGATFTSDASTGDNSTTLEVSFDTGVTIKTAIGGQFGNARAELELGYHGSGLDTVSYRGLSAAVDGDLSVTSLMLNGFYDIRTGSDWTPYLGAGIGIADIDVDDIAVLGVRLGSASDTVFAWQLMAGVGYRLTPSTQLDLMYRYMATSDPDFGDGIKSEYASHDILLGVRTSF